MNYIQLCLHNDDAYTALGDHQRAREWRAEAQKFINRAPGTDRPIEYRGGISKTPTTPKTGE